MCNIRPRDYEGIEAMMHDEEKEKLREENALLRQTLEQFADTTNWYFRPGIGWRWVGLGLPIDIAQEVLEATK